MKIDEPQPSELQDFLASFDEQEMPPSKVRTRGIYDNGKLIGCYMAQEVTHVGPFYLLPEYLESHAGALLIRDAIRQTSNELHVVAMNARTAFQCERMGMERIDGSLWIRE